MLRGLWFLLAFLFVFFGILFLYDCAKADGRDTYSARLRMSTVKVTFSVVNGHGDGITDSTLEGMIAEHGPVDRVELWCIFVSGSATMEYVATLDNADERVWTLEPMLLPIGIDLPYYLKMFYADGHMTPSESAYNFAVTKPPDIQLITRDAPETSAKRVGFKFDYVPIVQGFRFYHENSNGQTTLLEDILDGTIREWSGTAYPTVGKNYFYFKAYTSDWVSDKSNILMYNKGG